MAGAAGRLNPVTVNFDWNDRYNVFSGLIGGMFLALAYFGTDQSQVQRYLTGKSIGQSRLSLIFNALAKIPMQFFILFIGAMVFVFFTFERAPVLFQPVALKQVQNSPRYPAIESEFNQAFAARKQAATDLISARHAGDEREVAREPGPVSRRANRHGDRPQGRRATRRRDHAHARLQRHQLHLPLVRHASICRWELSDS